MSAARWRDIPFPGPDFHFGVWGDGQGRVWVVGQPFGGRTGLHRSDDGGTTWTTEPRPNPHLLRAATGTPGGVVWAVGDARTVLRRRSDREGWTRVRAGLKGNLLAIHIRGASEVSVADAEGAVHLSIDGGMKWSTVARSGGRCLRSLHGRSLGPLFAAGDAGLVLTSEDGQRGALGRPTTDSRPTGRSTASGCPRGASSGSQAKAVSCDARRSGGPGRSRRWRQGGG